VWPCLIKPSFHHIARKVVGERVMVPHFAWRAFLVLRLVAIVAMLVFLVACSSTVPYASPNEDTQAKKFETVQQSANLYIFRDGSVFGLQGDCT
jgi:hypothetical protein